MEGTDQDQLAKAQARSILGPSKETEFLQSFVRVGIDDDESEPIQKETISKRAPDRGTPEDKEAEKQSDSGDLKAALEKLQKKLSKKKKSRRREEEVYTDKDRAAAVVMGSKDIKQSLSQKSKAERSKELHIPEEADSNFIIALSMSELRSGRNETALKFANKALELSPEDKHALVSRSKCHLLLGDPKAALADAEAALVLDNNFVKAIYQKAEALFYSGEFEHSLMFYHRGLSLRPDQQGFRLGIQKAQEAIENTIGACPVPTEAKNPRGKRTRACRPVSQLLSDKAYLENLLSHPDLTVADRKNTEVMKQAEEAIRFLENREEFWRQQSSGFK